MNKSISIPWPGNNWKKELCADLAEAARTTGYVETNSNKADCLHKYVQITDEDSIKRAYEVVSNSCLKKLGIKEEKLLKTMPGIGNYAAQIIQSEIGNVKRFLSPKKLCNYAGIIPSQSQSGDKIIEAELLNKEAEI